MKKISLNFFFVSIVLACSWCSQVAWACASCGCTLSADWEDPSQRSTLSGLKLDFRYDYINQNQLRSGASQISPGAASQIVNSGNPQEVEQYTVNNYWTLGLDYSPQSSWATNVQIPLVERNHSTLGTASNGTAAQVGGNQYTSNTASLGDVRIVERFYLTPQRNWAIEAGVKLATGATNLTGTSTDSANPGSALIDPGLQPGSGSTDGILGFSYAEALNKNWDWYGQIRYQAAVLNRAEYRPGNGGNLNLGLRYLTRYGLTPQLQVNARQVMADTGSAADTVSTGGTLVYLSPGLAGSIGEKATLYGYIQIPIYQYVQGVQLVPTLTASTGYRYSF